MATPRGDLLEDFHHVEHGGRIVAGLGHVFDAGHVRLGLIVAAVFELHHLVRHRRGHLRGRAVPAIIGCADADGGGEDLAELAFRHLLRRVAIDDVAGLMTQHAGEFGFILELGIKADRDKDLTSRQSEGVDGLGIAEQVKVEVIGVSAILRVALIDDLSADRATVCARGSSDSTSPPISAAILGAASSPSDISSSLLMAICWTLPVTGLTSVLNM